MLPELTVGNAPGYVAENFHRHPTFKHYLLDTGVPVFGRASFWYRKQTGDVTSRVADIIRYAPNRKYTQMLAYCYLRDSYRVFTIESVWGFRDRVTGLAQDDLLAWLQSVERAPELTAPPSPQNLALWTSAPTLPSTQQVQGWLKFLGDELCMQGGAGYACNHHEEPQAARIHWHIKTPKKRGAGSLRRADVTYTKADFDWATYPDGTILKEETRFRIKPWTLYVVRTKQVQTFEHFSQLRASLREELFRSERM